MIRPPRILLMGQPGSGKTWSIATLAKKGINIRLLALEPGSVEALVDAFDYYKVPIERLAYHYIPPADTGFDFLLDRSKQLGMMDYEAVTKIKGGIAKRETQQLSTVYQNLINFEDQRTGNKLGPVQDFDDTCALVLDSLSGLNIHIRNNFVGLKPSMAPGEWGVVMTHEEDLLAKLTSGLRCYFVLLSHIDREKDEVTGATSVVPSALGSKLGPKIGRYFSEVILQKRTGQGDFVWSTQEVGSAVLQRALPISASLPPDFAPIVDIHEKRKKQVGGGGTTPQAAAPTQGMAKPSTNVA